MKKPFDPNLRTPKDQLSKEELNKISQSNAFEGDLYNAFRDESRDDIEWEAEAIAKSHGIYLEFDRANKEKDWYYMIRLSNPGGGPIGRTQWQLIDDFATKYTTGPNDAPSIRLTTRQAVQFHWLKKKAVLDIVKTMAENGMNSLNACGDNTRNVMSCPMSRFSKDFNANKLAQEIGDYFQLPVDPFIKVFTINPDKIRKPGESTGSFKYGKQLLNRKFKIGITSVRRDKNNNLIAVNAAEGLTNDMCVVPLIENNQITRFQIYVGGGQGQRNGKPSIATLAKPLCIVSKENLMKILDAVVATHQEIGDRQNRHWARLKYVIKYKGIDWFKKEVEQTLGFSLELPIEDYNYGNRELNHGWTQQETDDLWSYGIFLECGRVNDVSPNGKLKSMLRYIMETYDVELIVTPNQDAIITNIKENEKQKFEKDLAKFGYGQRNGKDYSTLRKLSGACVGRDSCRLTYTDSEKFIPELLDQLEEKGWGDLTESIGITGCERQCFRPSTKSIGLIGTGLNRYQLRIGGSESGKTQGEPLIDSSDENMYMRSIPRENVADTLSVLFQYFTENKQNDEDLGSFNQRVGNDEIIKMFQNNKITAPLMEKPFDTTCEMAQ